MSGKFTELIVDENSTIGAGTRIRLDSAELSSFALLKQTLRDCTRFDPQLHKLGYYDSESEIAIKFEVCKSEIIELIDEQDWTTCVEESKSLGDTPLIGVIIVGKNEKWNREAQSLTTSTFLTKSTIASIAPKPQMPVVAQPTPAAIVTPAKELTPVPAPVQPAIAIVAVNPSVDSQVQQAQAPAVASHQKEQKELKDSKEPSYRFQYTDSELEVVRKVPANLFAQVEVILAQKYEEGMVRGERAFKQFLEQQNKKKNIEHIKAVEQLHKEIEVLKKELQAAGKACERTVWL